MNKKYFYLWIMIMVWQQAFISGSSQTYYGDPKVVKEFHSDKFTDDQRQAMIDFLNNNGLMSQSSMQGTMTALNRADLDLLLINASRILVREVNRQDFPNEFANKLIFAIKNNNLPKEFGRELLQGLIQGLGENLENNQVIADLTKSINKSLKQISDEVGADLHESVGQDSKFGKQAKQTIDYYTTLFKDAYQSAVLENLVKTGVVLVVITAALYSVPFAIRTIERQMKRPKLIIESSQLTVIEQLQALFAPLPKKEPMASMVFNPTLKKYLDDIVKIVSNSHAKIKAGKTNIKYRNLMLYGPPGTGKTMFAKELARCSNLEFAYMSGSSFSKFQEGEAIEALDELFAWAKKCNGLMIFIDEAETFLSKRENMDPQSKAYQLLNNFLNYTGQRSSNFMIVFATNHKHVLDSAMYRRIDDLIEMPLPSKAQRIQALVLYKNKILMDSKQNEKSLIDSVSCCLNNAAIEKIAQETKGLSYGDLEGIINNIKTEADILNNPIVSAELIKSVVSRVVKKHQDFTGGNYLGFIED